MKSRFLKLVRTVLAPIALVAAMAAFSPVSALAANRGGHEGGRSFSAPARGFNGGRAFYGGRGDHYAAPRYYGPGFGVGVGVYAPYGYAAPVCNPAGFYDQAGIWHVYPGCAVPYGY